MNPTTVATPNPTERTAPLQVRARSWFRRYPVAGFLVSLILALVTTPFEEQLRGGDLLESARLTLVMLTGLLALGGRRKTLAWGIALVTPAMVGRWVNHWRPDLVPAWLFLPPALLFFMLIVLHLLRFILHASRVDSEVLCAGIAGYLMVGLLWALAYILVARLAPDSFIFTVGPAGSQSMKGFTALYFSFITLTTVGYGDIVPMSGAARTLAMTEAVIGLFYVAVLISRLVAVYSSAQAPAESRPPSQT